MPLPSASDLPSLTIVSSGHVELSLSLSLCPLSRVAARGAGKVYPKYPGTAAMIADAAKMLDNIQETPAELEAGKIEMARIDSELAKLALMDVRPPASLLPRCI